MNVEVFTERRRWNNKKEWGGRITRFDRFVRPRFSDEIMQNVKGGNGIFWNCKGWDGRIYYTEQTYSISCLADYQQLKEYIETRFAVSMPKTFGLGYNKSETITFKEA